MVMIKYFRYKMMALMEWNLRGRTGVYRWYYGKKYCVEWDGSMHGLKFFWEDWKIYKEDLKKLGFGVFRDKKDPYGMWIIFCDISNIDDWVKEFKNHGIDPYKLNGHWGGSPLHYK